MFFLLRGLAVLEKNSSEGLSQDVRQTAQYMRSAAASEVHAGFRAVERLSQSAECVGPSCKFQRTDLVMLIGGRPRIGEEAQPNRPKFPIGD